jgi:hypothetical protein
MHLLIGTWYLTNHMLYVDDPCGVSNRPPHLLHCAVAVVANSLRCTKILSQRHHFWSFFLSPLLLCKDTFVDDYDGI